MSRNTAFEMPEFPGTFWLRPSGKEKNKRNYALHLLCGKGKPLSEAVFSRALAVAALETTLKDPLCVTREAWGAETRLKFAGLYLLSNRLLSTEYIVLCNKNGTSRLVTSYGTWDGAKRKAALSTLCDNIERAASVLSLNSRIDDGHKGRSRSSSATGRSQDRVVLPAGGSIPIANKPKRVKGEPMELVRLLSLRRYQGEPLAEKDLVAVYKRTIDARGLKILDRYPIPDELCSKTLSSMLLNYAGGFAYIPWSRRSKKLCMRALLEADEKHLQAVYDNVPAKHRDRSFLLSLLDRRPEYVSCLKQHERSKQILRFAEERNGRKKIFRLESRVRREKQRSLTPA